MNSKELLQKIEDQKNRKISQLKRQNLLNSDKQFYKPFIRSDKGKRTLLVYKKNWNGHTWIDVRYYIKPSDQKKAVFINNKWFQPTPNGIHFTVEHLYEISECLNFFNEGKSGPKYEFDLSVPPKKRQQRMDIRTDIPNGEIKFIIKEYNGSFYVEAKTLKLVKYQIPALIKIFDRISREKDNYLFYNKFYFDHWIEEGLQMISNYSLKIKL